MDKVKSVLGTLLGVVASVFPNYRKAVVAFLVAGFVSFLARNGYNLAPDASDAVATIIDAALVAVTVFLVPNKPKSE